MREISSTLVSHLAEDAEDLLSYGAILVASGARLPGRGRSRGSGSAGRRTIDVAFLSRCSLSQRRRQQQR